MHFKIHFLGEVHVIIMSRATHNDSRNEPGVNIVQDGSFLSVFVRYFGG